MNGRSSFAAIVTGGGPDGPARPRLVLALGLALADAPGPSRRPRRSRRPRSRSSPGSRSSSRSTSTSSRASGSGSSPIPTGTDAAPAGRRSTSSGPHPGIDLVALYGPEHGVRGNAQAGEYVPFYYRREVQASRCSASTGSPSSPTRACSRTSTSTCARSTPRRRARCPKRAWSRGSTSSSSTSRTSGRASTPTSRRWPTPCRRRPRAGIDFIVLDRPAPVNGVDMEGAILEYPEFSSFVGLFPIP